MNILKETPRPAKISFVPSPDKQLDFAAPPSRFILSRIEDFMMITAFVDPAPGQDAGPVLAVDHTTKATIAVQPGLVIMQVNGAKVAAEASVEEVQAMLRAAPEPAQQLTKVAVRDMDAFMHLIRIRDGKENLKDICTEE